MRGRRIGCGVIAMLVVGCGVAPSPGADAATEDRDAAAADGGPRADTGVVADGGAETDAARGDAGVVPEACTGGVDEDGDFAIDCADDECWSSDDCIAADVGAVAPGLVACGDPIELGATETAAACAAIGSPSGSTYTTECDAGTLKVTARLFCDSSGAAAALWIEERLETPRTTRMLSDRRFETTYYERASILDWERHVSGASTREGPIGAASHDGIFSTEGESYGHRVITVRPVLEGDVLSRLLGMQFITSVIDLDAPMSMDTRSTLFAGGLTISIPSR